jgi:hypothetical protein
MGQGVKGTNILISTRSISAELYGLIPPLIPTFGADQSRYPDINQSRIIRFPCLFRDRCLLLCTVDHLV